MVFSIGDNSKLFLIFIVLVFGCQAFSEVPVKQCNYVMTNMKLKTKEYDNECWKWKSYSILTEAEYRELIDKHISIPLKQLMESISLIHSKLDSISKNHEQLSDIRNRVISVYKNTQNIDEQISSKISKLLKMQTCENEDDSSKILLCAKSLLLIDSKSVGEQRTRLTRQQVKQLLSTLDQLKSESGIITSADQKWINEINELYRKEYSNL